MGNFIPSHFNLSKLLKNAHVQIEIKDWNITPAINILIPLFGGIMTFFHLKKFSKPNE